ncbi:MAG: acylphosphatase [Fervidicoccaceae archaeon]
MPGKARVHIRVYGRVQGVFFRAFVKSHADRLGITGWVKNVEDGSVEIVAEGEEDKLKELIGEVRRGPPLAFVEKIEVDWEDYRGEFHDFQIKRRHEF